MLRKLFQSQSVKTNTLQKGINLLEKNQPKEAISVLKDAIKKGEDPSSSHFNLGLAYYLQKDTKMAIKEWESSLKIEKKPDTFVNLANVYLLMKDNTKAIRYYEQAIELDPSDGEIHFNLGVAYEKNGELDKALNYYREARDYGVEEAAKHFRNVAAKQLKFNE
eukprot:NODE_432_length_8732_cov_0.302907.p5 type:complete len:164 gc:universal NODE_432_length_8732_cov_0.302907:4616-5107(+)